MKRIIWSLLLSGVLVLSACGNDETSGDSTPGEKIESNTNTTVEEDSLEDDPVEEVPQEEWADALIETWSNDFKGLKTTITRVQKSENAVYHDLNGEEQIGSAILIDFHIQNTSEENFDTFPTQATLVTDTGEQIEGYGTFDSTELDSEIYPGVQKQGSAIWYLENSKVSDVKSVKLIWDSFTTSDHNKFENVADLKLR